MGVVIATGVHYRTNADVCRAAIVMDDNPPAYDTMDLDVMSLNVGVVVHTHQNAVTRDTANPKSTRATWHYPSECPDG